MMETAELESQATEAEFRDALAVVLERADEQGTVEWADVRADLTGDQWGRLLRTGILIDANYANGFVLDDPDGVREVLGRIGVSDDETKGEDTKTKRTTDVEAITADEGAASWTTYDKMAAMAALGLMGFEMSGNRTAIGHVMNAVYGPLESVLPFYVIVIVLALFLGAYSTVLQSKLIDREFIGRHRQRMNDIQARRDEAKERGDEEALERVQEEQREAMGGQMGLMKAQFRPMVWIVLLTIPAYLWMYWMVQGHVPASETAVVLPLVGRTTWTDAVLGPVKAWLVWYFLCSITSRQILRKALGIQSSPTPTASDS